jgi:hypothetical protein
MNLKVNLTRATEGSWKSVPRDLSRTSLFY